MRMMTVGLLSPGPVRQCGSQVQRLIAYAESEKKKRLQEVGVTPEFILQKVVLDNRQIKKVATVGMHTIDLDT